MASTIDDSDDNESETEWDLETEQGSEILDNINNYYRTEDALALDNFVNKEKRLSRRLTSRTDAGFDFDEYIPPEEEKKKYPEKNYYKMYKKFFLQPPEKAAIWRPRPPLTYDEMTLIQKADYVSERIAIDFIAWMKEINQDYNITLTPENLMSMFEIGSQNTLAKTLDMKMKEIPTLPPKIALSKKMPHLSNNAKLAKEIRLDIVASKRQPRIFAFSSRLPAEELIRPQLSDIAAKWHKSENVREDIVSMEVVWKGITHLRSTKEFSNYLQTAKPHVPHPEYLVRKGVFERLSGSDASSESNTSSSS
ncbi:unnamed protein product [Brassicogethes aeneus]|uniref:Uncharacterized protein n=1 Tax=Brassicogethes aeneus TaxID=1431903 RepID=A0A9P0BFG6_BRAAE|nr:unnamed protein product [Brassicogethes aeneus]